MHGWEKSPDIWKKYYFNFQESNYYDLNLENNYDFVVVLAGGINEENKDVYPWIKERLDLAINIYKKKQLKIICCGGGTYHKPPILNDEKFVISESQACSSYLIKNGVKPEDIYKEWASYDTIANGYFAFTNFIMQLNIKKFILITSKFHIERSKLIFDYFNKIFDTGCDIKYIYSNDDTLDKNIFNERYKREINSAENLKKNVLIRNKKDFINWFFTEHKAYNAVDYKENVICEKLKKTY